MIPIVWKEYRCTVGGAILKTVKCEKCQLVYVYQMHRQVQGVGASVHFLDNEGAKNRSRAEAEAALQRTLESDFDLVPCLQCGHYESNMVQQILLNRYVWLPWLAILFPLAALLFGVITLAVYNDKPSNVLPVPLLVLTGVLAIVAVACIIAQIVVSHFDPNATPAEVRQALGRERAVTRDEFQQLMNEQEGSERT